MAGLHAGDFVYLSGMKVMFPQYSIGDFINQPGNRTEFEIMRFEEMEEPEVDDVHKHLFYEILWIEKGQSRQIIDYQEYTVSSNTLFFISPGQVHQFEEWRPLTGGTILFTENFFLLHQQSKNQLFELSFLDNVYANPCLRPDKKSYTEIRQTIDWMLAEKQRPDSSQHILHSLLHILLTQIQRCVDKQGASPTAKKYMLLFKQFKELVDQHFATNLTASAYAEKLHITQHHLNFISRQVSGKTATAVIQERSLLEAKRLLTFTDHSVGEIAAQLNYFDSSYFAKLFKAATGQAPAAFREAISEKYRTR
jgi:AraC family transcriptional regulator, transcriptional activator of pobA